MTAASVPETEPSPSRVLVIEDDLTQQEGLRLLLQTLSLDVSVVGTVGDAISLLKKEHFHAILLDLALPDGDGSDVLRFAKDHQSPAPIIVMTGQGDLETAERCIAGGAFDYLSKPFGRLELQACLRRALLQSGPPDAQPRPITDSARPPFLIGRSDAMEKVFARIGKVAEADTNVVIYGESGTGKDLVARAIHSASSRSCRPLIVLDCAAIPENLLESELFGHVKGAFTSAFAERDGAFQLANGGSLFLDEVAELTLPMQAKLLRVIQSREFRKVGGSHSIKVDVRILCATRRNLGALVAAGRFREDLYYRLEVIPITVPPLRERKEDIPLLVDHFVQKFNETHRRPIRGVSSSTMAALIQYHWPGNVRQLENFLERAGVMSDDGIMDVGIPDLAVVLNETRAEPPDTAHDWPDLKEAERKHILRTLELTQGNRATAADLLRISLRTLYYKLQEIRQNGFPPPADPNGPSDSQKAD